VSAGKPKDQKLCQTGKVAADDSFPRAAVILDPETLAELITALKVLRWAGIGPKAVMDMAITAAEKLLRVEEGSDRGRESRRKKSVETEAQCIAQIRELMERKGLSKAAATERIIATRFPGLNPNTVRRKI